MHAAHDEREYRRVTRERAHRDHRVRLRSVASVHGALRSSLRTGLIEADDRLDESTLVDRFSVSRNAVRAALGVLVDEGIVSRSPRAGTVVRSDITDVQIDNGVGWRTAGAEVYHCEVLERRWVAATPLTRRYLADDGPQVHLTELVLVRRGEPTMLYTRFSLSDGAERRLVLTSSDTHFDKEFTQAYGSPLGAVDCWVEAVEADGKVAAELRVPVGTALLVKSRVLWSADGVPREYSVSHYLAARTALSTRTRRGRTSRPAPAQVVVPRPRTEVDPAGPPLRRSATSVHGELRAALRSGLLPTGARLDEQELATHFGVSRNSMRRGLARLADEGLVRRNRRTGTTIERTIADLTLDNGIGWDPAETERYRAERLAVATVPTPPFLARILRTDDPTINVGEYRVYRDGRPFIVYLRYSRAGVPTRPLSCDSLADFDELFAQAHGSAVNRIETTVHAVRAHERTGRLLDVPPSTLLLLKERLLIDGSGKPCEFSHSYYAAAGVALSTRSSA
jgi:GntR family transcriptional regulator